MDAERAALLRAAFEGTAFDDEVVDFAGALGTSPRSAGDLLLVGTPDEEPWHFAAHLTDEAEWAGRAELAPTLVRWQVPENAPPHLAVGLERLTVVRSETLLVVSPDQTPERLLDDVQRARRNGARVLAIETDDHDLRGLAHEALTVPASFLDVVQHVVSATAPGAVRKRSLRDRLGRMLDGLQGAPRPPR